MIWRRLLLVFVALAHLAPAASAGLFSRKPKPNPVERVPELLIQLKSSADEAKRSDAAEELRQFDPKAYPEIMPVLITALSKDASSGVRAEAAASLGKLRPISQLAGYALEQAQNTDNSMRVRLAARQALLGYHLVGYRSGGRPEMTADKDGAAVANPAPPLGSVKPAPPPSRIIMTPQGPFRETAEPPLADPPVFSSTSIPATPVARPKAPAAAQVIPSPTPKLTPVPKKGDKPAAPPSPSPANDGPTLAPVP